MKEQPKDIKTLADLTPDGENFNRHTEFGTKLLEDSLRKFGAGRSILVDKDGNIIAGNSTAETAAAIGMDDVVVVQTDGTKLVVVQRTDLALDTPQGRELALADNMTALKGIDIDLDKVRESLGDDLAKAWGMEIPEVQRTAQEDDFDPDSVTETVCKKGDIWKLGNHRLMCGDSTDAGSVALLMDGEKADLALTDPPYGISVVSKDGSVGGGNLCEVGVYAPVIGDDTTETAEKAYRRLIENTNRQVIFGGNYFTDFLPFSDGWLIWDKRGESGIRNNFADGEMAWCSFHTPVRIYHQLWCGMIKKGEHDKRIHPTQKPVKMISEIMSDFSSEGNSVLDLFGGSGTTLIAAEQLNRRCFMMELDPHYCDVIIARWEKLTGNKAERISNGN